MGKFEVTPAIEVARAARLLFAGLAPGRAAVVALAAGKFWRQRSRQAVNTEAYRAWGSGWYQLTDVVVAGVDSVRVTRRIARDVSRLRGGFGFAGVAHV